MNFEWWFLTFAFLTGVTLHAQVSLAPTDDRAEVALQAAIRTEIVDGDLKGAIRQYEAISRSGNRKAAAEALVKMGRCYEKLGDPQAASVYSRVIREYRDQSDAVRVAKRSLPAITNQAPVPQAAPTTGEIIGWYNGDWCHDCAKGLRNQMISDADYALVYDDFVVPSEGWTITGVFSNNRLTVSGVTQAYWEIRTGMSEGKGGKVVASKTSPVTLRLVEAASDGSGEYEVRVDGLNVKLSPGRYWLTVAPVMAQGFSYVEATIGTNAVGTPAGDNGDGYTDFPRLNRHFMRTDKASPGAHDSSQGVRIAPGK